MSGEMSIAPMMTAVEFIFSPSDAMKIAQIRIHIFGPLKSTSAAIDSMVFSSFSLSRPRSKYSLRKPMKPSFFLI